MRARVVRIGNSIGVIIPKAVAEASRLRPGDGLDVEFDAETRMLFLSRKPLAAVDRAFVREVEEFSRRYDADLKRLAE